MYPNFDWYIVLEKRQRTFILNFSFKFNINIIRKKCGSFLPILKKFYKLRSFLTLVDDLILRK